MSLSFWPMTRASRSVPPPGAKPTMMRTGCVGSSPCACASVGSATDAAIPVMNVLRCMVCSWMRGWGFRKGYAGSSCSFSGGLLEGDRRRMGGEVFHRRRNTRIRKFDTRKFQAHLATGERGHQREVVAVTEMADAKHAALHLA